MKNEVKYGGFVDFGDIVEPEGAKPCEEAFGGKGIDTLVDALNDDMRRRVIAAIEKELRQEIRVVLRKARWHAIKEVVSWCFWRFGQMLTKRR